jgi:hypothetical protein
MADPKCDVIREADNIHAADVVGWRISCTNAIADVIGRPSKTALRRAIASGNKSLEKKEARRYLEHKKLFDKLVKYSMEAAEEAGYDPNLINPTEHANDWQRIFARRLRGEITPVTIMQGERKVPALNKLVDRIFNKRDKIAKSEKGISKAELFIAPPEFVASHIDKFGFMGKFIQKILTIQDRNIQMSRKFLNPITSARKEVHDAIYTLIKAGGNDVYFNNSAMNGIETVDKNGNSIRLLKKVSKNIGDGFEAVALDDETETVRFYTYDEIGESKDTIDKALASKYIDELMDEIGNGQVRYITPQIINRAVDESGFLAKDAMPGEDLKKLKQKIKQLFVAREIGDRVPGIHTKTIETADGEKWEYRYVMIKQGEGKQLKSENQRETYNAYLIDKARIGLDGKRVDGSNVNFLGATLSEVDGEVSKEYVSYDLNELNTVLQEGWYRSDEVNDFGKQTRKIEGKDEIQYKDIEGTHKKQYIKFRRYAGIDYEGTDDLNIEPPNEVVIKHLWKGLATLREQYKLAYEDLKSKADKQLAKANALRKNVIQWRGRKYNETEEEAIAWLNTFYEANGIETTLWENEQGELQSSTAFSKPKAENYFPNKYHKIDIFMNMIPAAIKDIKRKIKAEEKENQITKESLIKDGNYEGSDLERLNKGLEHLNKILDDYRNNNEIDTAMFNLPAIKNLKHITSWTDPLQRRKDGGVHDSYFNESYNALNKQDLINELAETAFKIEKIGTLPKGSLEFIVNRVKIAFGDPTSRAISITGKETSYEEFSNKLNALPDWIKGGRSWTPKQAERLTKWLTAPASMLYLGGSSAVQNSGQIINTMIQVGWDNVKDANKELEANPEKWNEIAQNTGALNVLTMFTDIMMQDGEVQSSDMGFLPLPGLGFQIPTTNVADLIRLLRSGRENFVKNGQDQIDGLLSRMILNQQGASREKIQQLKSLNELRKAVTNKDLKEKRGHFFDVFTLEEGADQQVIERLFKDLLGDVSDSLIKRMVSWKLSWWFEGVGGKDIFTFTGSENRLRKTTIVAALLHAQKVGLIGGETGTADKSVFMTPAAVKIARNAVYYTQFGMTPPHLGEGFNGFGRALWQYKQYPTLQMIHDYQIWKQFMDGNEGTADALVRLLSATANQMKGVGSKYIGIGKDFKGYDPSDRNIDHDAIAMVRFITTRVMASAMASLITAIPLMSRILKGHVLNAYSMMRGAENPLLAITFRAVVWTAMFGMGAEDEEEKRNEVTNALQFLFFPVMLGSLFGASKDIYEWYQD